MSHVATVLAACLFAVVGAQGPTIESAGLDVEIKAPAGDVTFFARTQSCAASAVCESVATTDDLSRMVDVMSTQLSSAQSTIQTLETALNAEQEGTFANDVQAQLANRPTEQAVADQYVSISGGNQMYGTISTVQAVASNLDATESTLQGEISRLADAVDGVAFPICDPLRPPSNGQVSDNEEHIPGVTVAISCNNGFALRDDDATEALCLSNETWTYRNGNPPVCRSCPNVWIDVPWALDRISQVTGGASVWNRDIRSGNPGGRTSWRYPAVDVAGSGVSGFQLYYQFVTGYGNCGANCNENYRPPRWTIKIIDADSEGDEEVVWDSDDENVLLQGYDYDSCCARNPQDGCWGLPDNPDDGCYSPRTRINVSFNNPLLRGARRVYVKFEFDNRNRNVHINDDSMNMKIYAGNC